MSIRQTVGGAQNVVTRCRTSASSTGWALKPRVVEDEHGGFGVPRCEDAAPGVLRPPRRADVPVTIARLQADPVEASRGDRPDSSGACAPRASASRRAGREVQQQGIGRGRRAAGSNAGSAIRCRFDGDPSWNVAANGDPGEGAVDPLELRHVGGARRSRGGRRPRSTRSCDVDWREQGAWPA